MISYQIERLLNFALQKNMIQSRDVLSCRNALLDLLQINEPFDPEASNPIPECLDTAYDILQRLLDYCAQNQLIPENTVTYRDLMDAKIMGCLMPRPSEVNQEFYRLYQESGQKASDYFYELSKSSNYIQVDRINKNLYWTTATDFGKLEITINLSKPEKDPKDIAAAKLAPQTSYPKCLLCRENEGFVGNINHPARQNLRLLALTLNDEDWYMQYSPYVYYNEHCIVLHKEHIPMKTSRDTFARLLDFVEFLPHYFLGSNAGIPIVGGSILSHEHYQGGNHIFPMELAEPYATYTHKDYPEITISLVKWPMSVIRIASKKHDKEGLIQLALHTFENWKAYSDPEAEILAYSGDTPHNAITPIARINRNGELELDLVLRNNRTSETHPMGIFHPHADLHHIKKENIGLIEVMGLAVLPGRLANQLDYIKNILTGKTVFNEAQLTSDLQIFGDWIKYLVEKHNTTCTEEVVDKIVKEETGLIFLKVLQDAGVYKYNKDGMQQFDRFMQSCSFSRDPQR